MTVAELITVITASTAAVVAVITAWRGIKTNAVQDVKLDRITVLVDGRYGEVLQELADVKRLLAAESGLQSDRTSAAAAQVKADEQKARVSASVLSKAVNVASSTRPDSPINPAPPFTNKPQGDV